MHYEDDMQDTGDWDAHASFECGWCADAALQADDHELTTEQRLRSCKNRPKNTPATFWSRQFNTDINFVLKKKNILDCSGDPYAGDNQELANRIKVSQQ